MSRPRTALSRAAAERASDGHDLAGGLHLRAEACVGERELVERPARDLDDAVVERGLEGGLRHAGDGIGAARASLWPSAILVAILAIGYPVALLASAEERETRGLTSMTL